MTGPSLVVLFPLALICFGVKTEPSGTRQAAVKRRGLGQRCCPHLPVWTEQGILGLVLRRKSTPPTEAHLIQHHLTYLYCVQAGSAAAPFLALKGDQAAVVQTLSVGAAHAIRIWIISTKTVEHTSLTRNVFFSYAIYNGEMIHSPLSYLALLQ